MQRCVHNSLRTNVQGVPQGNHTMVSAWEELFTCKSGCIHVGAILQQKVDQDEVLSLHCIV